MNCVPKKTNHKLIAKEPKNTLERKSFIQQLKSNGVPPAILSSLHSMSQLTPSQIRKLTFPQTANSKSMSQLGRVQNMETVGLNGWKEGELLKKRDSQVTRDCWMEEASTRRADWEQMRIPAMEMEEGKVMGQ